MNKELVFVLTQEDDGSWHCAGGSEKVRHTVTADSAFHALLAAASALGIRADK